MTTATQNKPLTAHQKFILRWMDEKNIGAVPFEGAYRFPEAFRRDPELAQRFDAKMALCD